MKVYRKLFKYVEKEKYLAYISIVITALSCFLTIVAYYYLNLFLREIIIEKNPLEAKNYALIIVSMLSISGLLYYASVVFSHILGFRLETNLRKKGINGLSNASFTFFDMNASGKIRKIIDDNAGETHQIVAHLIPDNAGVVLTPILALVLSFFIGKRVGIALLGLVILSGILLLLMMGDGKFMQYYQDALENLSSEAVEYVRGIQVVKIFGKDLSSFRALYQAIMDYSKYAHEYSKSCKKPYVIYQWLFICIIAFLIPISFLINNLGQEAEVIAVELIMILFLSGVIFSSFMKVMYVSMYSFQGLTAVEKLENLFSEMDKNKLKFGNCEEFKNFNIEFDNVSFAYGNELVIKDLSFRLEENKSYALVGASGSGKSTLAKLISGFYKVDQGSIKIGEKPIESYKEEVLIDNIAFVFQNVKLFKTSIYENVKIGKESASRDEVLKALKLAGCNSILDKFPDREETIIGSKGVYLSGGEKQRIAIARAILKDAKIIILDEASAAVDPENEYELQLAFSNLMKDKTVIMIAHRLTSIKNVDEILVIDNGKIIERGNHKDLVNLDGTYNSLQNLYNEANNWRVGYEGIS